MDLKNLRQTQQRARPTPHHYASFCSKPKTASVAILLWMLWFCFVHGEINPSLTQFGCFSDFATADVLVRRCFRKERRSVHCLPHWRSPMELQSPRHWSSVWQRSTQSSTLSFLFLCTCNSGLFCTTDTSASVTRVCFCFCVCSGQRWGRPYFLFTLKMWCRPISCSLWPTGCSTVVLSACSSLHSAFLTCTSHR